ncbi:MAG: hypothetical protein JWP46_1764 [Modestobacter sp.]|nr:hypothetical protein [Modestobacter sp.]
MAPRAGRGGPPTGPGGPAGEIRPGSATPPAPPAAAVVPTAPPAAAVPVVAPVAALVVHGCPSLRTCSEVNQTCIPRGALSLGSVGVASSPSRRRRAPLAVDLLVGTLVLSIDERGGRQLRPLRDSPRALVRASPLAAKLVWCWPEFPASGQQIAEQVAGSTARREDGAAAARRGSSPAGPPEGRSRRRLRWRRSSRPSAHRRGAALSGPHPLPSVAVVTVRPAVRPRWGTAGPQSRSSDQRESRRKGLGS